MTQGQKILLVQHHILHQSSLSLASSLQVSRRTLYDWEHDLTKPSLKHCLSICVLGSVTLDSLLLEKQPLELVLNDLSPSAYEILQSLVKLYETKNNF